MDEKQKKCHNCKFSGPRFKIGIMTHMHCLDEKQYNQKGFDNNEFSAQDTLREFWQTCKNHEFKDETKVP